MNLFLNAVCESWFMAFFDEKRKIIKKEQLKTFGMESEKLLWILDLFLKQNSVSYNDLENILVVAGPWSFTWIRTITLLVNTISFTTKTNLTSINFFDLYNNYPIIKSSSKRDSFLKKSKNSQIEVIKNEELLDYLKKNNIKKVFWENKNLVLDNIQIFENIDYSAIIKNTKLKKEKLINPIYIKKPNIS